MIYEARQPVSACLGIVRLGTSNASGIEYLRTPLWRLKRAKSQGWAARWSSRKTLACRCANVRTCCGPAHGV